MSTDPITTPEQPVTPTEALDPPFEDFWGVQTTEKFFFDNGRQFFEVRPMDEGGKALFQRMTSRGVRMNQRTQDAHLDMDPASDRHTLIKQSVVGWRIMQRSADGSFSEFPCPDREDQRKRSLDVILEKFNPKVIQDLEHFIRLQNPWMQDDMNLEQVDEEIERLTQLRRQIVERQAGEGGSANK